MAGLCSSCLPDMELSAIYSSLTAPGTRTVLLLNKEVVRSSGTASNTPQEVGGSQGSAGPVQPCRQEETLHQVPVSAQEGASSTAAATCSADGEDSSADGGHGEEETQLSELFSGSEESDSEGWVTAVCYLSQIFFLFSLFSLGGSQLAVLVSSFLVRPYLFTNHKK